MHVVIHHDRPALGQAAGSQAAAALAAACAARGSATLVVATGSSQFEVLATLAAAPDIPWDRVTIFHLDEYCGLAPDHPASFRRYLRERFVDRLPVRPAAFHELDGLADPEVECRRLAGLVPTGAFDVALIGIGENGHLAFNDPPADFETRELVHVVQLDEACRLQQVGEGHFASLDATPTHALSLTIHALLQPRRLFVVVPEARKARAVRDALRAPITPDCPASILRTCAHAHLYLDAEAAALL